MGKDAHSGMLTLCRGRSVAERKTVLRKLAAGVVSVHAFRSLSMFPHRVFLLQTDMCTEFPQLYARIHEALFATPICSSSTLAFVVCCIPLLPSGHSLK